MTDTVSIVVAGDEALRERFASMQETVREALFRTSTILAIKLERHIVDDKLSGQVLNRVTGNLAGSIFHEVQDQGPDVGILARVASAGDVRYARIHEFGGIIKHPGGTAYLPIGGKVQFISNLAASKLEALHHAIPRTKPHDIPMPERSFMRSALADMRDEIVARLRDTVIGALRGSPA